MKTVRIILSFIFIFIAANVQASPGMSANRADVTDLSQQECIGKACVTAKAFGVPDDIDLVVNDSVFQYVGGCMVTIGCEKLSQDQVNRKRDIMDRIISFVGWLATPPLASYLVIFILSRLLNFSGQKSDIEMPKLIPLVINTKHQPSFIHKIAVFVIHVRRWKLAEDWSYKLKDRATGDEVTLVIEKGFEFDGVSVPKVFWAILSPTGLLLIPGLLHDYGYRYDQIWKLENNNQVSVYAKDAGKKYWDQLFKDVGNEVNNVGIVNFIAMLAVAVGGKKIWEGHREANKQPTRPALYQPMS